MVESRGRRKTMEYADGNPIRVGHVVRDVRGPERYIVLGPAESNFVHLLLIGTIQKQGSPSFGETIILEPIFTRDAPAGDLTRMGSARINIVPEDPII
jgi:hypothetical protein